MKTLLSLFFLFLSSSALGQSGYYPWGDIHWKSPVASIASLPAGGNSPGDARTELTAFGVYIWNGGAWAPAGGPPAAPGAVGAFGNAPNAAGGTLAANILTLEPADATNPGGVSTAAQTFAGQKTFSTGLTGTLTGAASLNVLTSALGNLTDAGTDGITIGSGTNSVVGNVSVSQHVADATHNGYLSSADWNTFSTGAGLSFGAFGSTPNANGGSISAGVITLQPADGTHPGGVTSGTQTLGGDKTFNGNVVLAGGVGATSNIAVGFTTPFADTAVFIDAPASQMGASSTSQWGLVSALNANSAATTKAVSAAFSISTTAGSTVGQGYGLFLDTVNLGSGGAMGHYAGLSLAGDTPAGTAQSYAIFTAGAAKSSLGGNLIVNGPTSLFNKSTSTVGLGGAIEGQNSSNSYSGILTDPSGRGFRIATSDFDNVSTGSLTAYSLGTGSGNTYSRIQAYSGGGNVLDTLSLQTDGGNVGIGTTTPTQALSVSGNVNISGLTASEAVVTDASKNLVSQAIGSLTDTGTDGITVSGGTSVLLGTTSLSQHVADATHNGYLSSADWNTFSAGGGGSISFTAVGSTPNANGASVSGSTVTLQPADGTHPGLLTSGSQIIAGSKTFNGTVELSGNFNITPISNSVATGSNARLGPATESNITLTNASLVSIGSADISTTSAGDTYTLTNSTGANITIINNYSGATSGEKIFTPSGANAVVENNGSFILQWNSTVSGWTMIGGSTTVAGLTTGSVLFADGSGNISQDNTNFSWDETNKRLNLGGHLSTAGLGISVTGTEEGFAVSSTASNTAVDIQNQGAQLAFQATNATSSATQGAAFGGAFSRGTLGAKTAVQAGDQVTTFSGQSYNGSAFGPGFNGAVAIIATENQTSSHNGGEIVFATTPNGSLAPVLGLVVGQNQLLQLPAYTTAGVLSNDTSGNITSLGTSGTGNLARVASPTFTGTVSTAAITASGNINNTVLTASLPVQTDGSKNLISSAIDLSGSQATGALAAGRFPALTGDITTSAGSLATTAAANQANIVTLSKSTGVAVHGTNTNDSAASGYVGEYISQVRLRAAATTLTTTIDAPVTSGLTLTAGDWDLTGEVGFSGNSNTITAVWATASTSNTTTFGAFVPTNSLGATDTRDGSYFSFVAATATSNTNNGDIAGCLAPLRVTLSTSQTIYLMVNATFSTGTLNAFGRLTARRVR